MEIRSVKIKEIKPYDRNAKKHDDTQINNVAESIRQFGFVQPIVIDSNGVIVIGHCRFEAAKRLKYAEVPCIMVDDLTPEQVDALRIVDNKTNESPWDIDLLADVLPELDLDGFDFDWDLPEDEEVPAVEEDDVPEVDEDAEQTTKFGNIWQLGNHRLMCGDSTNIDDVEALLVGQKINLLLTDPPYGVSIVNKKSQVGGSGITHFSGKTKNKIIKANKYREVLNDDTTEMAQKACEIVFPMTENQIVFGGNYFTDFLKPSSCWIVWDKENNGNFADVELAWTSFGKAAKLYRWLWDGLRRKGARDIEGVRRVHPTQKPVGLLAGILRDFSGDGATVLDLFGGSGSTLMACEQIGRTCFMMEYEAYYCDVIIKRWEEFTGNKAVLLNG